MNAVVDESLRLGAPFPGLPRVAPKGGATLDGTFIPEGTIVGVPAWAQHTTEDNFYPMPEAFRPERWFVEGLGPETRTRRSALMTFSYGVYPHCCSHGPCFMNISEQGLSAAWVRL